MNMVDLITKKRDGGELSENEIREIIKGYTSGKIADYQMSALLMAFYFQGLTNEEIFVLTDAMMHSGAVLDLSDIPGIKVDKHSSGGVGDKISLIIGPIVAAAGVKVAKMSGRGLGFTGGTIDKLHAIKGFRTDLTTDEFKKIVADVGVCITGQTEDIAKADKLLYALRDVTGTVDVMGLIASSIMSKKLAMGSDAILLDVKYGKGALMKDEKEAKKLADLMVQIGENAGKKMQAVLSDMNQPLGNQVGNANEVIEAIETLKGNGPEDLRDLAIDISAKMICLGEILKTEEEAMEIAKKLIENGEAIDKFREFVKAQGGDDSFVDDYLLLPQPEYCKVLKGADLGLNQGEEKVVLELKANEVGEASLYSGAGRERKEDEIDLSAGIELYKKVGHSFSYDEPVARVFGNNKEKLDKAFHKLKEAYVVS